MIRLGSLFDGIGGFPLAAEKNGICPVWASEVERFPVEVTKYHFPQMRHMGDITKLKGENPPVRTCPWQDAGKGLTGNAPAYFWNRCGWSGKCAGRRKGGWEVEEGQISLFDLGIWSGKMCREPSPAGSQKERISTPSLRKSAVYRRSPYLYLDRRAGHGLLPGLLWEKDSLSLGGYWTLNFGESPRDAAESSLSQILEATVPEKYYLSPKACGGIIRRSGNRGKKLPEILDRALRLQAGLPEPLD